MLFPDYVPLQPIIVHDIKWLWFSSVWCIDQAWQVSGVEGQYNVREIGLSVDEEGRHLSHPTMATNGAPPDTTI